MHKSDVPPHCSDPLLGELFSLVGEEALPADVFPNGAMVKLVPAMFKN